MRNIYLSFLFLVMSLLHHSFANAQQGMPPFDQFPVYNGNDLGVHYTPKHTHFNIWAPTATGVTLRLYRSGHEGTAYQTHSLNSGAAGTWQLRLDGDHKGAYYTFQVQQGSTSLEETPDMQARAVGVNGRRGMIVDLQETNPSGWERDRRVVVKNYTDIILYESHVRDLSVHPLSGIKHKGKFLGLTEKGTRGPGGVSTGLDHLKELGITHIHLLPSFDFASIDETKLHENRYNWGYDPVHYNVPEGSFSTDPFNGATRIREFKQMVMALHNNGIGVVMDVVYNHTASLKTPFNQLVPGYFYRHRPDGTLSDASGCGNETASERAMMRQFMIESVAYWAREYHIDGFRFDLMGIHDIETMNSIRDTLHSIDPSIFIYGEGWTAGDSPLPESERAVKKNTHLLKGIAAFSDDLRDGLRGPFHNSKERGFVSGKTGTAESVRFGIVASTLHPQIDYNSVAYSKSPWASEPFQAISYVSCHDDPTLFDRLQEANSDATEEELIRMDKLAQTIVFTSQGVPFLHSGAEMLRTKMGVHNSYKSPDSINQIDWSRKVKYRDVFEYYKGLVALRKGHPSFRLPSAELIRQHLKFVETGDPLLIAFTLSGVKEDSWKEIIVVLNGENTAKPYTLPEGRWQVVCNGNELKEKGLGSAEGTTPVPGISAMIFVRQ